MDIGIYIIKERNPINKNKKMGDIHPKDVFHFDF